MSKISDIYDALEARIVAVLPNHSQLPDGIQIEENSDLLLRQGYAITFGTGLNTQRYAGCEKATIDRDMIVTLTRKVYANENDTTSREAAWKALFEDQRLLIEDLQLNNRLESTAPIDATFVNDNGLEYVFGEQDKFIKLESVVRIRYEEVNT